MKKLSKLDTRFNLEMSGDTKLYMVSAKQGDKATRYVIAKLLNDGAEYVIPEDAIVVVNVKKPDGKRVYNTCSASGSEVTIELTNQILAASGTAYCDVEVRTAGDEQVITSASFTIEIEESMRSDSAILSSNEYTELERREKLRQEAEEHRQQNEALRQEAEEHRQQNEALRQEAEEQRQRNETSRQTAEGQRQRNETSRQTAEGQRQQNVTQAIEDVNKVSENCRKVTERAENALQSQEQLEETLNTAIEIKKSVEKDKEEIKTAYVPATQSANGLMSAADKKKLDGIAEKATANSPSTTKPKANGTAAAGSESEYARGDHVHPLQTSVSGNAGTSDKWTTARNINGMSVQGDADRANYGSCSTAAATAAKVVACTGFALATGSEITVKFTVTNTAANPTLNVNGTGAKPIYYRGAAIAAGYLAANRTYTFRYNGIQYELVGDLDTNTTYSAASQTANGLMSKEDKTKLDTGGLGYIHLLELNSITQLNQGGLYMIESVKEAFVNGDITDANKKLTDWSVADFHALLLTHNITTSGGCVYGTLILTSPRFASYMWIGQIWEKKFISWKKVYTGNVISDITNYGACSTAAATAAKVVACTGFALVTGVEIVVKFTVTNTAANPTLNVNSTGAKPIYYRGAAISAGYLAANRTYAFRYNGTQYELVGDLDTNTTYAVATASANGLLSAHDKTWIDGKFKRYIYGADSSATNNYGYYKVAALNITSTYRCVVIKLRIMSDNFVNYEVAPFDCTLVVRSNSNTAGSALKVVAFCDVNGAVSKILDNLYVKYTNVTGTGGVCEIYFNKTAAYQKITIDVVSELVRGSTDSTGNYQSSGWVFSANGVISSAITGTGYAVQTFKEVFGDFTSIGSATKPIYLNKGVPTACSKALDDYLPLSGGTVAGTLVLSKRQDAAGTTSNSPALIVGGAVTQTHLELDDNEIMAKSNGTTAGELFINGDGGKVTTGPGGFYAKGQVRSDYNGRMTSVQASAPADTGMLWAW